MITVKTYKYSEKKSAPFWRRKKFWFLLFVVLLLSALSGAAVTAVRFGKKIYPEKNAIELLSGLSQFVVTSDRAMPEEPNNDINILLLGVGGEGYYGNITPDTIIVLSVKPAAGPDKSKVSLLSLPRDLAISLPEGTTTYKMNAAYKTGELKQKGSGQLWARRAAEDWTGLKIPYYAVVDTQGFKQAIDRVGGVDVVVDTAFYDAYYPDGKNGYLPSVEFEAGPQHLDGERALEFARSRHGNNGEASDFARSRRQDKIIMALKDKVEKLRLVSDLGAVLKLLNDFAGRFQTNLEPWQLRRVYNLVSGTQPEGVVKKFLDPKTGLVCSEIAPDTGWYLLPLCADKTKEDVYAWTKKRFEPEIQNTK